MFIKGDRKIMAIERAALIIRIPVELKTWIEQQAARYGGSMNVEIARIIRMHMDAEQARAAEVGK
jgi:hypothetical protein